MKNKSKKGSLQEIIKKALGIFNFLFKAKQKRDGGLGRRREIGKSVFRNYLDCPVLGYLSQRKKLPGLSQLNHNFLIYETNQIRKRAQKTFPGIIDASHLKSKEIFSLLKNPKTKTLSGAKFSYKNFSARCDILNRNGEYAWDLCEIRTGKTCKLKYISDLSFNSMILEKSGVKTADKSIMYISGAYRLGMEAEKLFRFQNCNEKVEEYKALHWDSLDKISKEIGGAEMPPPSFKRKCKNCPLFAECIGSGIEESIFDMPGLSVLRLEELIGKGIIKMEDIPEDFEMTERQKIIRNCHKTKSVFVSAKLKEYLEKLPQPYFYLDFESINTVLPVYEGFAPHSQILTQFSIDKCCGIDKVEKHFEYIADPKRNCQEEIAAKLIDVLDGNGSIIVYSNFEKRAVETLAALYPQYAEGLNNIAGRIVDFEEVLSENYYDIKFKGRSSIKTVLPIMSGINYDGLEIGEGGDAAAAFAFMACGVYDEEKSAKTKEFLLKYCAQDTAALMKIHKFLNDLKV